MIPNCSSFAQFVLVVAAFSMGIGCVVCGLAAMACVVEKRWLEGLVLCPLLIVVQVALCIVFLRVRELGQEP
jgi:hypothetical protein